MNNIRTFILLPVIAAVLSACSSLKPEIEADVKSANDKIAQQQGQLRDSILKAEKNRLASQEVNRPFLAGTSRPLARDIDMPDVLRKPIPITALHSKTPVDLQTAAQELSADTGVSITVTPDAMLPPSAFSARIGGAQAANPVQAPARVVVAVQSQPLWKVLDDIARQAAVSWRPVQGGAEFYRVSTKVFSLSTIPPVSSTSASLGRNGSANSAFDSQSKSSFVTKDQDLIKGLTTSIDALLTTGGKATISSESQTVVVTDAKDGLDRVESFVKEQNRAMSRRVRVMIEEIEVTDNNSDERGVDWSLIYKTAQNQLNIAPSSSLTDALAGGITFTDPSTSPSGGSTAIIKALNQVGTVTAHRSFPVLTTSGRPVTQALRKTFSYVDNVQTSTVASSATTTSAPTVTQKEETVGTFVTIFPTAKADGTIFLSISFDVTSAEPLVPFTIGSGATAVTVQEKTIDGSGVIQELPMRSGQTVIIGGLEQNTSQSTIRRLGADAPILLGGSDSRSVAKTRTLLLVTAVAEEGI